MRDDITPLVLAFNEAPNIGRTLERLHWAARVVVVDSGSTDGTEALCRRFANVDFLSRPFDDHASQWNFGLDQVRTPWVLTLDADYVLGDELIAEFSRWAPTPGVEAYLAEFKYCVAGRRLAASLYPPREVLFNPRALRYVTDGHTQRLHGTGPAGRLAGRIGHDDRKPLSRWLAAQDRYASLEAAKLLSADPASLATVDRLRRLIVPAPILVACYALVVRGALFDGWPGWFYAMQRGLAEALLSLRLIEARLKRPGS